MWAAGRAIQLGIDPYNPTIIASILYDALQAEGQTLNTWPGGFMYPCYEQVQSARGSNPRALRSRLNQTAPHATPRKDTPQRPAPLYSAERSDAILLGSTW